MSVIKNIISEIFLKPFSPRKIPDYYVVCPECDGAGAEDALMNCTSCDGRQFVSPEKAKDSEWYSEERHKRYDVIYKSKP